MAINVYDKPAEQHVIQKVLALPYQELAHAALAVQKRADDLEQKVQAQKGLFKDLKHLKEDDPYAAKLQEELKTDVSGFYTKHNNLASREAQRDFYEMQQKWSTDQRALNLQRSYDTYTEAEKAWKKSQEETGNQDYNRAEFNEKFKAWREAGGTYGKGFDAEANVVQDPGFTKYMTETEIRETWESNVNDMVASNTAYAQKGGSYIYTGKDEERAAAQLRSAMDANIGNLMGGNAGKNLINKYTAMYGDRMTKEEIVNKAYTDMRESVVNEYVYKKQDRDMKNDDLSTAKYTYDLNNPIQDITRPSEAMNIDNPHGQSLSEYRASLQGFKDSKATLTNEFIQQYAKANGLDFKTAQTAVGNYLKNGGKGDIYFGNMSSGIVNKYKTQFAELTRQEDLANMRLSGLKAETLRRLGTNEMDLNAKEVNYWNSAVGELSPHYHKINGVVPNRQMVIESLSGMNNNTVTYKSAGNKWIAEIRDPSGKLLANNVDLGSGLRPDLRSTPKKKFNEEFDNTLKNDKLQISGEEGSMIPVYEYATDKAGNVSMVLNSDKTKQLQKTVEDYFSNPANYEGLAMYGPDGKPTDFKSIVVDMGVEDQSKIKLGTPMFSKGATMDGKGYFTVRLTHGEETREYKIPAGVGGIQNSAINDVIESPTFRAQSTWMEGKKYHVAGDWEESGYTPFPENRNIKFFYGDGNKRKESIQINGVHYEPDEGLSYIAKSLANGNIH
jgi:hypothetical protein